MLLFAYSLAVAHGAVPHCHHLVDQDKQEHHEAHHHNHGDEHHHHEDQVHVKHADHFDHGIWEFLFCILSETDVDQLHVEDQQYLHQSSTTVVSEQDFSDLSTLFFSTLVSFDSCEQILVQHTSHSLDCHCHDPIVPRGPPFVA